MEGIVVVGLHTYPQWRGMQRAFFGRADRGCEVGPSTCNLQDVRDLFLRNPFTSGQDGSRGREMAMMILADFCLRRRVSF